MVEHLLAKEGVAGSIPVSRSFLCPQTLNFTGFADFLFGRDLKTVEDSCLQVKKCSIYTVLLAFTMLL